MSEQNPAPKILAGALVFLFGAEMMRFHFASLGWYQRDTLGVGALDLIPVAVLPFVAGLVLVMISRYPPSLRSTPWVGAALLIGARLVTQISGDPAINHFASGLAVAAFVGTLVVIAGMGRPVLVGTVVVGITLDSAIKASGSSLDLAYRPGVLPIATVVVIAAVLVYLLFTVRFGEVRGPGWGGGLTLIGFGPLLFAQYLVLQSPGWLSERIGMSGPVAALLITLLNLMALFLVARFDRSRWLTVLAALVVAGAVAAAEGPALLFGLLVLVAIPLAGPLWAAMVPEPTRASVAPAAVYLTLASLIFLMVGFAYYLPLDLDLGFSQAQARTFGAVLLAVFGLAAAGRGSTDVAVLPRGLPVLASSLLLLPVVALIGSARLGPAPSEAPIRVMAYNIHQSFGTAGDMDVAAVADVIIDSGASMVGLQEIPRGGLLNAGTDLLTLLADRLGWEHYEYFGTTDPVWGNAILSRYPLGEVERHYLPTAGTPFRRGYLGATVDSPIGPVLFISTHLQHINDPDVHEIDPEGDLYDVHTAQLGTVIDAWGGRSPAVLVGDMNARPEWGQIADLLAAGWVDAWAEAGDGPGYTANAANPEYRIDYVFHTPDLTTVSVTRVESQASDHFAVVADLAPAR